MNKISDARLEGSVRKLVVHAHLAAATIAPFGKDENAVLDGLKDCADDVRDRLNDEGDST